MMVLLRVCGDNDEPVHHTENQDINALERPHVPDLEMPFISTADQKVGSGRVSVPTDHVDIAVVRFVDGDDTSLALIPDIPYSYCTVGRT